MKIRNVENNVENKLGGNRFCRYNERICNRHVGADSISAQKGITLIALIITIILMLILTGVVLSLTIGENGLFSTAKYAAKEYEIANIKEQIQIEIVNKQAENNGEISINELKTILEKYGKLSGEQELKDNTLVTNKGNYKIKVSDIFNEKSLQNNDIVVAKVPNSPNINGFNKEKTYYVTWDETSSPYKIEDTISLTQTEPNNWYDYTAGTNKWANIKTTGGGNDCYWVWIPRYAYKVPQKDSTIQTIEVKFLSGTTNIPIKEKEEITNTKPIPGEWVVHPAFTNAGNGGFGELEGIWVAKFEASSNIVSEETLTNDLKNNGGGDNTNLQLRIKPNVTNWREITIDNAFKVCRNLTNEGNSLEQTTVDAHMIKNTEWGAVAYLARSIYGKNSIIWNNPYYTNEKNSSSITGLCGETPNSSQTNLTNTYKYNADNGEGKKGTNASTTGNVYGIYDMVGGSWEYVAAYLGELVENDDTLKSKMQNLYNAPLKYKDLYKGISNNSKENFNKNTDKYGDAIYEIVSDQSLIGTDGYWYPETEYNVFIRGPFARHPSGENIFEFDAWSIGEVNHEGTFRPTVINQ